MIRRLTVVSCVAALVGALLPALPPVATAAEAAEAALFDPGYIISDTNFFDSNSLNSAQVQQFLVAQVSSCATGFTCLKDYVQATPNMSASRYCSVYGGSPAERASEIIAKVGQACGISPKVLLVLLQKEQGLVTLRNPSATRFANATGFGCPDSAPCDPAYSGFFYQVYYAARQFQVYTQNPTSWNYRAGNTNQILYSPNAACGRGPVYIVNQATANLYIYTPYQPNGAALANLYGTGDACSSYGNRNFWRIYSDWFGSPTDASSLFRTVSNPAVYLISGGVRHRVPDLSIFAALASLGPVQYVSQDLLDRFPISDPVGRIIRDPAGKVYFIDAGVKFPFKSCEQLFDYGGACADGGYVQLAQEQAATFTTGPELTSVVGTREGGRYFIDDGTKAEISDDASQTEAGIPLTMTVMSEVALVGLDLAAPITREGGFVRNRSDGGVVYLGDGQRYVVTPGSESGIGAIERSQGGLTSASMAFIPRSPLPFTGYVVGDGQYFLLSTQGRLGLEQGGLHPSGEPIPVSSELLATFPDLGSFGQGDFIKSPDRVTVYVAASDQLRPLDSWDSLLSLSPPGEIRILTVSQSLIASLPIGPPTIRSGSLVRSPERVTVYVINGLGNKLPLRDFAHATEAGMTGLSYLPQSRLDAYPTGETLDFGLICGGEQFVSAGGTLHLVSGNIVQLYPFKFSELDPLLCGKLRVGQPAGDLIRVPAGQIYLLEAGVKRQIMSMTDLARIAPEMKWLSVSPLFAASIPSGPPAVP